MGRYPGEAGAQRRVEQLQRAGCWPGIIRHADGTCDLTWDPSGTTPGRAREAWLEGAGPRVQAVADAATGSPALLP